ncbi:helix-turn-helix transcriptional regulator [Streptomyces sp. NPDC102467]|uniref:helix-turn-helix transcriptional regulator n=1 Tax=Streptomyces sp. NPDC102467 TaxID=3366179 RepID=UPI0037F391A5
MSMGDDGRDLGAFLRARRGRVTPERAGISAGINGGARRRVAGLRREELAQLAGISVDYLVRLEQGRATQPSPEILNALATALGLDTAERAHLTTLATGRTAPPPTAEVSPLVRSVLDALSPALFPAFVTNHRLDVVAWNALGAELMGGLGDPSRRDPNNARFLFLDPAARALHPAWETRAAEAVGQLRVSAARYPGDAALTALIAELSAHSAEFRALWATGEVVMCTAGRKQLRHPATGPLDLDFETLHIPAEPGEMALVVHIFRADPTGPEAKALTRLPLTAPGTSVPTPQLP